MPVVPAGRELGMGPTDRKNEGLEHKKEASRARIKALDPKNEALSSRRGVSTIKIRVWKLRMQLGPYNQLAGS